MNRGSVAASARRIAPLAWPVFVGQVSVLAFSTVDTVLVGRHGAGDLAALAIGGASYATIFVGLMGVVLAIGPITGQLFGAGRHADAGRVLHQAVWVALGCALIGSTLLAFPHPLLALARASPEVEAKARAYMLTLAFALPATLLFAAYRGFNIAISRPKAVMLLQLGALALKVPLSALLVSGVPALGLPALGVVGCGLATVAVMWLQLAAAAALLARHPAYAPFALRGRRRVLDAPSAALLGPQLRLGLPIGATTLIEVSGFTLMALFISRLGTTPVAGHQIAVNVVSLMFMMPLAIGNGCATLVAQRIGAGDAADARRLGRHGVAIGAAAGLLLGSAVFLARRPLAAVYAGDAAVMAAALPLLTWVALFHVADAIQAVAGFVLRAWRVATVPLVVNAVALWGLGLGGGYFLAFGSSAALGARGFWLAATAGLVLAAVLLVAMLAWVMRRGAAAMVTPRPATPA